MANVKFTDLAVAVPADMPLAWYAIAAPDGTVNPDGTINYVSKRTNNAIAGSPTGWPSANLPALTAGTHTLTPEMAGFRIKLDTTLGRVTAILPEVAECDEFTPFVIMRPSQITGPTSPAAGDFPWQGVVQCAADGDGFEKLGGGIELTITGTYADAVTGDVIIQYAQSTRADISRTFSYLKIEGVVGTDEANGYQHGVRPYPATAIRTFSLAGDLVASNVVRFGINGTLFSETYATSTLATMTILKGEVQSFLDGLPGDGTTYLSSDGLQLQFSTPHGGTALTAQSIYTRLTINGDLTAGTTIRVTIDGVVVSQAFSVDHQTTMTLFTAAIQSRLNGISAGGTATLSATPYRTIEIVAPTGIVVIVATFQVIVTATGFAAGLGPQIVLHTFVTSGASQTTGTMSSDLQGNLDSKTRLDGVPWTDRWVSGGTTLVYQPYTELIDTNEWIELYPNHTSNCWDTRCSRHGMMWWNVFSAGRTNRYPRMNTSQQGNPAGMYLDPRQRTGITGAWIFQGSGDPLELHITTMRVTAGLPEGNAENPPATIAATQSGGGVGFFGYNGTWIGSSGASMAANSFTTSITAQETFITDPASVGANVEFNVVQIGDNSPQTRLQIRENGDVQVGATSSVGARLVARISSQDKPSFWIDNTYASMTGTVMFESRITRASGNSNKHVAWRTAGNLVADILDTGEGRSDVGWNTPASDYAEFYGEWWNADQIKANPVAYPKELFYCRPVVLVPEGNPDRIIMPKMRGEYKRILVRPVDTFPEGTFDDFDSRIFSIVSHKPGVLGNEPMHWQGKHLTDRFGLALLAEEEVWTWTREDIVFETRRDDDPVWSELVRAGKVEFGRMVYKKEGETFYSDDLPDGEEMPDAGFESFDWAREPDEEYPLGLPNRIVRVSTPRKVMIERKVIDRHAYKAGPSRHEPDAGYQRRKSRPEWAPLVKSGQGIVYANQPWHPSWRDVGQRAPKEGELPEIRIVDITAGL